MRYEVKARNAELQKEALNVTCQVLQPGQFQVAASAEIGLHEVCFACAPLAET